MFAFVCGYDGSYFDIVLMQCWIPERMNSQQGG